MLLFTSVRRRPGEVGGDREHHLYLQEVPPAPSRTAAGQCAQPRGLPLPIAPLGIHRLARSASGTLPRARELCWSPA